MPRENDNLELSRLLHAYRIRNGVSLSELAHRTNISINSLKRFERGDVRASRVIVERLVDTLRNDPGFLEILRRDINRFSPQYQELLDPGLRIPDRENRQDNTSLRSTIEGFVARDLSIQHLPKQSISIHFAIASNKISSIPSQFFGDDENDYARIRSLQPLVLGFVSSAIRSLERSDAYRNLLRTVLAYDEECRKSAEEINYAILYAYGLDLRYTYDAVLKDIGRGEIPDLSADQQAPIESLLQLHGPFILASKDGRELVSDADRYVRNPQEERDFQEAINELVVRL